jgi:hypothetical protein
MAHKSAVASIKFGADKHAANILPVIREAGASTLRQIAEALNARGVATAHGGDTPRQLRTSCTANSAQALETQEARPRPCLKTSCRR